MARRMRSKFSLRSPKVQRPAGLNGLELQSRLIADVDFTPVNFVTAFPEERFRDRAMSAGTVGFLSKTFDENSLMHCLGAPGIAIVIEGSVLDWCADTTCDTLAYTRSSEKREARRGLAAEGLLTAAQDRLTTTPNEHD